MDLKDDDSKAPDEDEGKSYHIDFPALGSEETTDEGYAPIMISRKSREDPVSSSTYEPTKVVLA